MTTIDAKLTEQRAQAAKDNAGKTPAIPAEIAAARFDMIKESMKNIEAQQEKSMDKSIASSKSK